MAIKGVIVMTGDLEHMHTNLLNNQVPAIWQRAACLSLKPLGGWMRGLPAARAFMMSGWLKTGAPDSFWLPGFFFPQGFMTGVLQTHARKYAQPIDSLNFNFRVLEGIETAEDVKQENVVENGVLADGLFVDNARWNAPSLSDESEPSVIKSRCCGDPLRPRAALRAPALLADADPEECYAHCTRRPCARASKHHRAVHQPCCASACPFARARTATFGCCRASLLSPAQRLTVVCVPVRPATYNARATRRESRSSRRSMRSPDDARHPEPW